MENRKLSCSVIEDLLPSYADDICSLETRELVRNHLAECESCKAVLLRMQSSDLKAPGLPHEDPALVMVAEEFKKREKRHKRTSGALGGLSAVLGLCLIISLAVPPAVINAPGGGAVSQTPSGGDVGNGSVTGSFEPEASPYVGVASAEVLGDYKAASDYKAVYDYLKSQNNDRGFGIFDMGGMKEEAATDGAATGGSMNGAISAPSDGGGAAGGFSSTNVMTAGVDESDISKTDGDFIYNATGSEIFIFAIGDGEAELVSKTLPEFLAPSDIIREIYVDGDELSVVTEHASFGGAGEDLKNQTLILIYDVSHRENPVIKGRYVQDGSYRSSRKVGDLIYLFTTDYLREPDVSAREAVKDENLGKWIPTVNGAAIDSGCIYLPGSGTYSLAISSFSTKAPEKVIDSKLIISQYAEIYVGSSSIILYASDYTANRSILKLTKLSYNEGLITAGASTSVRGYLNDAFAINEYNGYLRLVTTEWDTGLSNMLYVLDSDLKETGRISNIANGESLYACRFMGDVGYFVTFEVTDPLFTVDLSDPKNPEIIGELKIPGFSEYLHFWGDGRLLGIGYDADSNGMRQGLKISMFDVSDPSNVTELSKALIPEGDYAPGFYSYRSVLAYPEANILGFAYMDYTERGSEAYYVTYSFEDGSFIEHSKDKLTRDLIDRARGHYAKGYFYLSEDTKVTGMEYRAN